MSLRNTRIAIVCSFILMGYSCRHNVEPAAEIRSVEAGDTAWRQLSLREKIGQTMCLNYNTAQIERLGGSASGFFKQYPVGAFFMANWELSQYASAEELADTYRKTVAELQTQSPFPLLISEDFETGLGSTLPQYTPLTSAMGLGATGSEELATRYGEILSQEARSIGLNWILNPVVDLILNPSNYLTNVRSVGSKPEHVQRLTARQIKAMQANGVGATAKHFPGDGTDYINQHFTTSQVKLSRDEWQKSYGKVFQRAIDSGVMCIMAGHISFPAYQKEPLNGEYLPATLSKELLTQLLKNEMGFNGVVLSDALNMGGIANYYSTDLETQIECFKAGTDLLLWPDMGYMDSLEARILRKEIAIERLNDAVHRVWNMKTKLGLFNADYAWIKPLTDKDILKNRQTAYEMAKASISEVSNKNNLIPFDSKSSPNILLVITTQVDAMAELNPLKQAFESKGFKVEMRHNLVVFNERQNFDKISQQYDKIIFAFSSRPGAPWGSLALHDEAALTMWSANTLPYEKVVSVTFGDPYKNLLYMPRVWARYNCYGWDTITQQVLVDCLVGNFKATGKSPVSVNK